jgi:hypothetical protein
VAVRRVLAWSRVMGGSGVAGCGLCARNGRGWGCLGSGGSGGSGIGGCGSYVGCGSGGL